MKVKFYKTTSNDLEVNKALTSELVKNVKWLEETDFIRPTLILSFNPINYNYVVIDDWDRRYFIRDFSNISNGLFRVELEEDFLSTWWDKIRGNDVVLRRNENNYNTYLNDSEFICYNNTVIQQKTFPSGFDTNPSYYLTVCGGDE